MSGLAHSKGGQPAQALAARWYPAEAGSLSWRLGRSSENQPSVGNLVGSHAVAVVLYGDCSARPIRVAKFNPAFGRISVVGILDEFQDALIQGWIEFLAESSDDLG